MRTTLLPLSLGCLLLAAGCNCGDNTLTRDSGSPRADSGAVGTTSDGGVILLGDGGVDLVALTITIVGEGSLSSQDRVFCSSATDPCVLNFAAGTAPSATAPGTLARSVTRAMNSSPLLASCSGKR